jgi:hypothetical protein
MQGHKDDSFESPASQEKIPLLYDQSLEDISTTEECAS